MRISPATLTLSSICLALGFAPGASAQTPPVGCRPDDTGCVAQMRQAATARADSATARTDTILVGVSEFAMNVGDSISLRALVQEFVRPVALDREGQGVPFFASLLFLRPEDPVVRIRNGYLCALSAGTTVLFVGGSRFHATSASERLHPSTQVRIVVQTAVER
jgi:hypothetical protein